MTITTLFGTEEITTKPRTIRFKQIKAVYETLIVKDDITNYLKTGTRFTSPHSSIQVTEKYAHLSPRKLSHAAQMLDDLA